VRLAVVLVLLGLIALAPVAVGRWRRSLRHQPGPLPRVPSRLLAGDGPTWLVFTTPYCASCGPVAERLRAADPRARVVTVDATRERELADAFSVRTAPTAVLADADGDVRTRLVGAAEVAGYVRRPQ
jgi:thiol-disulfide isomerase/thioredoxin